MPTYDWTQAASTSIRMAGRLTKRNEVLVSEIVSPDRFDAIKNYVEPVMKITKVNHNWTTGLMDMEDLKRKFNPEIAAIYFENPWYFGIIETQGEIISEIAHKNGSLSIVGTDPLSLGLLRPPSQYGANNH